MQRLSGGDHVTFRNTAGACPWRWSCNLTVTRSCYLIMLQDHVTWSIPLIGATKRSAPRTNKINCSICQFNWQVHASIFSRPKCLYIKHLGGFSTFKSSHFPIKMQSTIHTFFDASFWSSFFEILERLDANELNFVIPWRPAGSQNCGRNRPSSAQNASKT